MKRVTFPSKSDNDTIDHSNVSGNTPIFIKKNGVLKGLIVKEAEGWIARMGGSYGDDGFHATRLACMNSSGKYGFTFHIEDDVS